MTAHLIIPDTQAKPGVPTAHLSWVGQYVVDHRPDTVIHLGDHWDMPSLSSYDKGKRAMEGRRYSEDVVAGNEALALVTDPIREAAFRERRQAAGWKPRLVLLRGNHEARIERACEDNAQLEGAISYADLESPGWEVHDFLEVVKIDGVRYSHYFYNPNTGRPYAGQNIDTRLKTIGHSFTMGHQQGLKYAMRETVGGMQHGLVAGSCYLHDEQYLGPQGNANWRGVVVCHQVEDGQYDAMFVSLDYLCRRYEGLTLAEFQTKESK